MNLQKADSQVKENKQLKIEEDFELIQSASHQ